VIEGVWVPLLIAALLITILPTWRKGVAILSAKTRRLETPLQEMVEILEKHPPQRVPGLAIFLTATPHNCPTALLHSLKHNKVLHEKNLILSVVVHNVPRVPVKDRVELEPRALSSARQQGLSFDIMSTTFFLSRRTVRPAARSGMPHWQDKLFVFLTQNADDASSYFQLPTDRVVEIGTQVAV
jgi:KUP system potassium uptake protein